MAAGDWIRVATRAQIVQAQGLGVRVGDRRVALHVYRDRVYAVQDQCPHRGAPLAAGCVGEDGFLACFDHGWEYDLATGRGRGGWEGCLEQFACREEDGAVLVQEKEPREDWPEDWFPPPPTFDDDDD